jgi:TPR repeat protein
VGLLRALVGLLGGCATGGQVASSLQAPPGQSVERLTADCAGGKTESCGVLGMLYLESSGVDKDERRAAELFKTACSGGVSEACR